jgi:hypothetical protein
MTVATEYRLIYVDCELSLTSISGIDSFRRRAAVGLSAVAYGKSAKLVCVPTRIRIIARAGAAGQAHGDHQLKSVIAMPNIAHRKLRLNFNYRKACLTSHPRR